MTGLEQLLTEWGLPLVYLGAMLEGDTFLFLAGALAHIGFFPLMAVIAVGAAGAYTSDQTIFHLGRRAGGAQRVQRVLDRPVAQRLMRLAQRHPDLATIVFRFVWGTRVVVPMTLGAAGVGRLRFALVDLLGVCLWSVTMSLLGYGLGATLVRIWGDLTRSGDLALIGGVCLALGAGLWACRRRGSR